MPSQKVAIITGGASGMGLAVAQALCSRGTWDIHIVDLNVASGEAAAASLSATFHQADVTSYSSLASVFKDVFQYRSRIDFAFANAGIAERVNFYEKHNTGIEPPPDFNLQCINICLNSVVTTTYLAQHYFRLSPATKVLIRS
jgi:NAD(P)-dependent dehydrogenase (short-subunit alcohol dehydrogenase family)